MNWLNVNINSSSCVILQYHFLNCGQIYLNESIQIVYYVNNLDLAVNTVQSLGYSHVYFVYWNQPIGWNVNNLSTNFYEVQTFNRISVWVV
jgi:hypothetical protein